MTSPSTFAHDIVIFGGAGDLSWRKLLPALYMADLHGRLKSACLEEAVRIFYLATAPSLFSAIAGHLDAAGLVDAQSRVVLEKPLGHDLPSAQSINESVARHFDERQIYRIDHYLGKETVQNLMVLRFSNAIFEPIWNRR